MGRWKHFEHAADVGVRGVGATPEEAFAQAGLALAALYVENPDGVGQSVEEPLACEGAGIEELLVAFLNEIIFLADARRKLLAHFEITIQNPAEGRWTLSGKASGDPYDPGRSAPTVEPKGATYTSLRVAEEEGRWIAQCVVDV